MPALLLLALAGCDGAPGGDALGASCPEDTAAFQSLVWDPVFATSCATCHVAGGQAEASRLVFLPEGADDWLLHNLRVATELAREDIGGVPLLVSKPSGLHPSGHGGGTLVDAGSAADTALRFWVSWSRGEVDACVAPDALACTAEGPGPRQLRRLTHDELDNTIADLLGVDAEAAATLAADDRVEGFDNNAAALDVSSLYADQVRGLAERVAWEANLPARLPCDPATEGQAPCAARFIEDFGLRAFRRPLSQADVDRYVALWEEVAATDGFLDGLRWVVAAMLQSPHFLYRMELGERAGDDFALTGWEIATELSYLYWRTTPDDALLDAADAGLLTTEDGRAEQVARLAADPRAAETVADFVDAWLELDQLATVSRDATTYPDFTTDVRAAMNGETRRLVADVASEGTLSDLLLARHTFVTPELATWYGLDPGAGEADAEGYRRVSVDGVARGGLLTQGSVLARWALPTSSSPIHRGVMVRERLLCQDLPPPPSNLDTSPPAVDPTLSTRERYAAHAALPECASCHDRIDPIGFGFERYDGVGRWREQDGEHAVDTTGEIRFSPHSDGTFDGVPGLAELLARSPDVQSCYATMWTVWGTGSADTESLTCAAEQLAGTIPAGTLGLLAPRDALLALDHFTVRTGEAEEQGTPAAGARLTDLALPDDDGPWVDIPWDDETNVDWVADTSEWGAGYCTTITLTNVGDETVDWRIVTDVTGTVDSSWCVTMTPAGDDTVLTGSGSCGNPTLAPGGVASVGWCASY